VGEHRTISELVPVFPLPEVVLFPRQLLPLHIFEPRYRAMTADALAGEGCIAISLLKDGFERTYFTPHAPIHSIVGVGQVVASEKLEDGRYNILLRGLCRARILEELPGKPYRRARLTLLPPVCHASAAHRRALRQELRRAIARNLCQDGDLREQLLTLCRAPLKLAELTDLVACHLPVPAELRQCVLEELDAVSRAQVVVEQLNTLGAVARRTRRVELQDAWTFN